MKITKSIFINNLRKLEECLGLNAGHYHVDSQEGPVRIVQNNFLELSAREEPPRLEHMSDE